MIKKMYLKDCTFAGHLCDVRIAWQRPGRPAHRVRPVWPVLPPPLCQRQGKQVQLLRNAVSGHTFGCTDGGTRLSKGLLRA